ncbi:hypothetical protein GH714_038656 [Hevea brasiliensis]|uniref:Uncharacterized protein n=1 Tax=Hevea brasiliensis TaxID=3981 RepID=A0A6A6MTL3_HEVBR|nr:hypothetical protein GH714_038656 [Hevea brasiliensis]
MGRGAALFPLARNVWFDLERVLEKPMMVMDLMCSGADAVLLGSDSACCVVAMDLDVGSSVTLEPRQRLELQARVRMIRSES